jgi:formylglycine-generating enzyme required for sulfatase activity
MSVEVAARLRTLAQDHYDGKLDLAAYRALRAPLLDSLSVTALPGTDITQPRATPPQSQRDAITRPGRPRAVSPQSSTSASGRFPLPPAPPAPVAARRSGRLAIAILAVAVAACALWWWLGRHSSNSATQAAAAGQSAPQAVQSAVEQFVGAVDWSDTRVTELNASLVELGGERISAVAHEDWFRRFVDELRRRLKEQQALSAARLTADNSPLAALAVTIGIDLNSPDAAPHIAPPPPPLPKPAAPTESARALRQARPAVTSPSGAATEAPVTSTHDARSAPRTAANSAAGVASAAHSEPRAEPVAPPDAHSAASVDECRVELVRSRRPLCHDSMGGVAGPEMAVIPAGTFDMGSTAASEEQPVHHVSIAQPFAVSVYEVSQGEFRQFCDATHRSCAAQPWSGDDYPVVEVSWDDARAYTDWLTSVTHHRYGLPTEAQWEYAARAGTAGLYPNGDATLSPTDANYSVSRLQTVAARRTQRFNANAFRLMHTIGNVREWVEDAWVQSFKGAPSDGSAVKAAEGAMRVVRGGSYADGASRLRLSLREGLAPGTRDVTTGFRIVRELP